MHTNCVKPLLCSVLSLCLITRTRRHSTPAALCLGWGGTNTHHTLEINLTPMENAHAFGLPSPPKAPHHGLYPLSLFWSPTKIAKLCHSNNPLTFFQYYLYSTSVDISSQRPLPTLPYFVKSRTPPTILFICLSIFKSISILLSHTTTINYSRSRRTKDTTTTNHSLKTKTNYALTFASTFTLPISTASTSSACREASLLMVSSKGSTARSSGLMNQIAKAQAITHQPMTRKPWAVEVNLLWRKRRVKQMAPQFPPAPTMPETLPPVCLFGVCGRREREG